MVIKVDDPFPVINDLDGLPLEAGFVYIGVFGLDPEGNPKQAYWDSDLTVVAAQPIRTIAGRFADAGSQIGTLYVAGAYSILVQDKDLQTVVSEDVERVYSFSKKPFVTFQGDGRTGPYPLDFVPADLGALEVLVDGIDNTYLEDFTIDAMPSAPSGFGLQFIGFAPTAIMHIKVRYSVNIGEDAPVFLDPLLKTGGTMNGTLILAGDPSADLEAATKQYVDNTSAGSLQANLTISIPTDYATINAAIEDTAHLNPGIYKIIINIESGHVISGGFAVKDGDYSHYEITSDDAVVIATATNIVASNRSPVFFSTVGSFAWAENAKAPKWSILVDAQNSGPADIKGFTIVGPHASFDIPGGCGIRNLGNRAIIAGAEPSQYGYGLLAWNGANVRANDAIITGSAQRNLWISRNSRITGAGGDFSGSQGLAGADPQDNANHGNVYVTRASWANLESADLSGGAHRGVTATRSYVNVESSDVSGCAGASLACDRGAWMNAWGTKTNSSVTVSFPHTPEAADLANVAEFNYLSGPGFIMSQQAVSWPQVSTFTSNGNDCIATRYPNGDYEIASNVAGGLTAVFTNASELRCPVLDFPAAFPFTSTNYVRMATVTSASRAALRGKMSPEFFLAGATSIIPAAQSDGLFLAGDTVRVNLLLKGKWK